jgi:hypothetical protein
MSETQRNAPWALVAAAIAAAVLAPAGASAQSGFPFEQEMLLDARPLPGSKRVPMLEVFTSGRAQIDLWCKSGLGQIEVTGTAVKVTLGPMREDGCTPERLQRDEEMAAALAEVTQWRRNRDVIVFTGSRELRFRLSTH